jgi:hypothetical protein
MSMPRLSLYKPERGQDYKFIDRQISEMFQVGGTDVYLHKYLGPANPSEQSATADQPHYVDGVKETNIQDLLLLENRDRKYDPSIYCIRGLYNVQNIDFNLSQFGLFIDNDTLFMTVHINDFIKYIGRKPLSGDVIELPHLRDEFALNDFDISLPRYYVIEDVGRASEGFSATWYPHLYRLKLKKITDNQQFSDILDQPAKEGSDQTLRDILSTASKELEINDAVLSQAENDVPQSGFETRQYYTLAVDPTNGQPILETTEGGDVIPGVPARAGYSGYLLGDGYPPNGHSFGHGIQFPLGPQENDFFLRTDLLPNRLFKYDGTRWLKVEDKVRHTLTNNDTRQTLKTSFINNKNITGTTVVQEGVDVPTVNTLTLQTSVPYTAGMGCKVFIGDSKVQSVVVTSGVGGNALITMGETAPANSNVQWTLFKSFIDERSSVSKAVKPKADL